MIKPPQHINHLSSSINTMSLLTWKHLHLTIRSKNLHPRYKACLSSHRLQIFVQELQWSVGQRLHTKSSVLYLWRKNWWFQDQFCDYSHTDMRFHCSHTYTRYHAIPSPDRIDPHCITALVFTLTLHVYLRFLGCLEHADIKQSLLTG